MKSRIKIVVQGTKLISDYLKKYLEVPNSVFYSKVQDGFLKLAKNKKNYLIVNSNLPIIENKKIIINKLKKII